MNGIENLIKNTGLRCKVTGAKDVTTILRQVFETVDHRALSQPQLDDLIERTAKEYELLILRQMR